MDLTKLDHIPAIKAVMTPFPYSVGADEPVARARDEMAEHGIRHLPVTRAGALVGVVSDRDVDLALQGLPESRQREVRVGDVCSPEVYVVELTERLDRVLLHMALSHVGSALVVKRGKLAGIFTVTDACQWFGRFLAARFPEGDDDEAA